MRCIVALVPTKEKASLYIEVAQALFSSVWNGYLLSDVSMPHITLCQFECAEEQVARAVWQQVKGHHFFSLCPKFTGLSFIQNKGEPKNFHWAELSVARESNVLHLHCLAVAAAYAQGVACLNDCGDLYRPHLTLARICMPEALQRWPDCLLSDGVGFELALGKGDAYGQFVATLERF